MAYIFKNQRWWSNRFRFDPIQRNKLFLQSVLFNVLAFLFIASIFMIIGWGAEQANRPLAQLKVDPVSLDYSNLFAYSLRTTLRMFIGICGSLIFTFVYAKLADSSIYMEQILMPFLDILQSVPILGFISFTITVFLNLFPGNVIGAELAAIFAIFTSQAWNMTYSFYQSLKNLPSELVDVCNIMELSSWQKFWKLELPYALPSLIWNMAISISSGWFFVVASEVIIVGNNKIALPGLGSYISLAIEKGNVHAIIVAVIVIILAIILFDQLFLRPILVWSDKYQYQADGQSDPGYSIVYALFQKDVWIKKLFIPFIWIANYLLYLPIFNKTKSHLKQVVINKNDTGTDNKAGVFPIVWYIILTSLIFITSYKITKWLSATIDIEEAIKVFKLTLRTFIRIMMMVFIVSIILVPMGIYIGLRTKLAANIQPILQVLAAFPANLLFPIWAMMINRYHLTPEIWLSPLLVIGAQWYILFNVIAGTLSFPAPLKEVVSDLEIRGTLWWSKIMLPYIMPYFMTGIIVAVGGAWNACIIAEYINYKDQHIISKGIGSYISEQTINGNLRGITLGILMMVAFVVLLNRVLWTPLYNMTMKKSQI